MIPCKRPRVTVDQRGDSHDVNCRVPGCDFTYPRDKAHVALKSDAETTAARHRQDHRRAVPQAHVVKPTIDRPGYGAECACGWSVGPDRTRADAQASLDYHLSSAHGLVSC